MQKVLTVVFLLSLFLLVSFVGTRGCGPNLAVGKKSSSPSILASMTGLGGGNGPEPGFYPATGPWKAYPMITRHDAVADPDNLWKPEGSQVLATGKRAVFFPQADCQVVNIAVQGPDVKFRVCSNYAPDAPWIAETHVWDTYGGVGKWRDQVWLRADVSPGEPLGGGRTKIAVFFSEVVQEKKYPISGSKNGEKFVDDIVFRGVPAGHYFGFVNGRYYSITVQ